jgi:ABC-type transport system involved in cytochrome c biogenesis permease subunit
MLEILLALFLLALLIPILRLTLERWAFIVAGILILLLLALPVILRVLDR